MPPTFHATGEPSAASPAAATAGMCADAALAALPAWADALERRHLADLPFAHVRRGAQALQQSYVGRRRLQEGFALSGRGKRAAFALLYAPMHYLTTVHAVCALNVSPGEALIDLGCGTGAGAAAWALCSAPRAPRLLGLDINLWALAEARWNWRTLGLAGTARRADLQGPWPVVARAAYLCAYSLNELTDAARSACVRRLLVAHDKGATVLVVEALARGAAPYWPQLQREVLAAGGREDEHRLTADLPATLSLLRRSTSHAPLALGARTLTLIGPSSCPR